MLPALRVAAAPVNVTASTVSSRARPPRPGPPSRETDLVDECFDAPDDPALGDEGLGIVADADDDDVTDVHFHADFFGIDPYGEF